jgi:hypothetical protein
MLSKHGRRTRQGRRTRLRSGPDRPQRAAGLGLWHKGDDWRWPCCVTKRNALDWMADWLRQREAFEPKQGWL